MNHLIDDPNIAYIRQCTNCYLAYFRWKEGEAERRGYFLHLAKRDWECAAAIYRVKKRQAFWVKWRLKS